MSDADRVFDGCAKAHGNAVTQTLDAGSLGGRQQARRA